MEMHSAKTSSQSRNYVTQPRYTMEVMDANRNPAEVVQIGDEGYLLLTLHEVFIYSRLNDHLESFYVDTFMFQMNTTNFIILHFRSQSNFRSLIYLHVIHKVAEFLQS